MLRELTKNIIRNLLLHLLFSCSSGSKSAPVSLLPDTVTEAQLLFNRGNEYVTLGNYTDAIICYLKSIEFNPDNAVAHNNLGMALAMQGQTEEAGTCFQRALNIQPDNVEALINTGSIACSKGEYEKANTSFQRALTIHPKHPNAWAALVSLRKMTPDDNAWLSTAEEIVKGGLHYNQESPLRFAMGKYCDDVNDYNQAFQHYSRANNLLRTTTPEYDRQNQTRFVNHMIQAYNHKRMSQVSIGASASMRPVFIVGMARSGTSLIEQIIASHPAAWGAGELLFWGEAAKKYETVVLDAMLEEPLLSKLAEEDLQLLSRYSGDATYVADKMPGNFHYLGLIHSVFPNARIIHAQRDPIDTCLSNYFQDFSAFYNFTNDLGDLAHYYREYHRLMAHWREVLPPDIFLDVPYEALVHHQEEWSRKIIKFIGLDWDNRCLDFHKTERSVATVSHWQVRQEMYKTSVGRWRNYEKYVGPLGGLMDLR